jgi:hypothetical protein
MLSYFLPETTLSETRIKIKLHECKKILAYAKFLATLSETRIKIKR